MMPWTWVSSFCPCFKLFENHLPKCRYLKMIQDHLARITEIFKIASFCLFSVIFKRTLQFLQQIYVKNFFTVYGAGIQTHNLHYINHIP